MKIVILDGICENPGDLSWDWLKEYGELTVYDRTPKDKIIERSEGAEIILTNKTPLNAQTLSLLPDLKFIAVIATGYNIIDTQYCKEHGITVSNIPSYSTDAVAQNVFAHILEHTNHLHSYSESVHNGDWSACPDFCYQTFPIFELKDKTIGIFGYGKIGKQVARIALAFNMKVLVHTSHPGNQDGITFTDLDTLIRESDFITLHCPLTEKTNGLVNEEFLSKMKKTAVIINTSRGPVIDEAALAAALHEGKIAGAGIDVMAVEPPKADNPLIKESNCSITPHIAWAGFETRARLMDIMKDNVRAFVSGSPINVVI